MRIYIRNGKDLPCDHCGSLFYHSPSKIGKLKFCSPKCRFDNDHITKKCLKCRKEFTRKKSRGFDYCSLQCALSDRTPWNKGKKGTYVLLKSRTGKYLKCLWCNNKFYAPTVRVGLKCCCPKHAKLYNKKRNTTIAECKGCGKSFRVKLRTEKGETERIKRNYRSFCSDACRKENYNSLQKTCDYCGKLILVKRSELNRKAHFCDKECFAKWAVKENTPMWRGGKSIMANTGHLAVMTEDFYINDDKNRRHRKYRPEHRILIEKYLGRKLVKNGEPVWHLNGIPTDNRLSNLYVFSCRGNMMKALAGTDTMPSVSNLLSLKSIG